MPLLPGEGILGAVFLYKIPGGKRKKRKMETSLRRVKKGRGELEVHFSTFLVNRREGGKREGRGLISFPIIGLGKREKRFAINFLQ